jgi:hypothetical protein
MTGPAGDSMQHDPRIPIRSALAMAATCAAMFLPAGPALAQSTWSLTVSAKDRQLELAPVELETGEPPADTTLNITCQAPVDCTKLELMPVDNDSQRLAKLTPEAGARARSARYQLTGTDLAGIASFHLIHDPLSAKTLTLARPTPQETPQARDSGGNGGRTPAGVSLLLGTPCNDLPGYHTYDRAANRGEVVVTATGMALTAMPPGFDEDDTLTVTVLADTRLLPFIEVRRTSPLRSVGDVSILGEDVPLPHDRFRRHAAQDTRCSHLSFKLGDLAPGKAEIEIAVRTAEGRTVTGKLELRVQPLYVGMFSLGAAWSRVQDPDFGLVSRGMDQVLSAGEKGGRRLVYALLYTPFVWGKRDVEKPIEGWYRHVNPTVGLALADPLDNAFAGASVDVRGAVITIGAHVSHVSVIDERSGLTEGDVFTGSEDDLPLARRWRIGPFVSVSVDLRAAVKIVGAVFAAATP